MSSQHLAPASSAASISPSTWLATSPAPAELAPSVVSTASAASLPAAPSDKPGRLSTLFKRLTLRRSRKGEEAPAAAPPVPAEPCEESLYYLTGAGRLGPLPLSHLYQMIADGELEMSTPVSRKGTSDWLTFTEYLATGKDRKSPAARSTPGGMAWGVALAPAWGAIVPIAATQASVSLGYPPLAYQLQMWGVVVAMNIALCFLDYRALKKSGTDLGAVGGVLCLLVPLYLCLRERTLPAKAGSLLVWSASTAISVAGLLVVNTANVPILTVIERMIHG